MSTMEDDIKAGIEEKGWKFVNSIRLPHGKNDWLILSKKLMNFGV
jgi:hypothetical protein